MITNNYNNDFYYMKNNKHYLRKTPKDIILCNFYHLVEENSFVDPYFLNRTNKFIYNHIQNYFMNILLRKDIPMHFTLEFIQNDWVPITGLAVTNKSSFLEEVCDAGIIEGRFKDSFLILILDNWKFNIPTKRQLQVLSHRILTPLMREYGILKNNIHFIEDLYREQVIKYHYGLPKNKQLLYNFNKYGNFFNITDLNFTLDFYNKS